MKKRDQPHDRYFKDLMQDIEIAQEFLLTYLDVVISEQIDWNTLELYDGSWIGGANKQLYADVERRASIRPMFFSSLTSYFSSSIFRTSLRI